MSETISPGTHMAYSIAPMLSVRNGARAVEFYKSAFGALEVYRVEDPGGSVVSRLSVDGAEFWLSDESPEHGNLSPESLGGGSVRMLLTIPDPDSMFAKAVAAGEHHALPARCARLDKLPGKLVMRLVVSALGAAAAAEAALPPIGSTERQAIS